MCPLSPRLEEAPTCDPKIPEEAPESPYYAPGRSASASPGHSGPSVKEEKEEIEPPASPHYDPEEDHKPSLEAPGGVLQPVGGYRPSSPIPVKAETTPLAPTMPVELGGPNCIKEEEQWLDSAELASMQGY